MNNSRKKKTKQPPTCDNLEMLPEVGDVIVSVKVKWAGKNDIVEVPRQEKAYQTGTATIKFKSGKVLQRGIKRWLDFVNDSDRMRPFHPEWGFFDWKYR